MKKIQTIIISMLLIISSVFATFAGNMSAAEIGGTQNGFTYGIQRIIPIISHHGKYNVILEDCNKINDNKFEVVLSCKDQAWRNGKFEIDIFPAVIQNQTVLEGYQVWFGYYDINRNFLGCAQVRKLK